VSESGLRVLDVRRQLWFDALEMCMCFVVEMLEYKFGGRM
jgi:hypothetical protein